MRRAFNSTFKEYLTARRIEGAKVLLLRNETVASAAKMNGLGDPAYFTRVFRRVQGMTPSDYLKTQVGFVCSESIDHDELHGNI